MQSFAIKNHKLKFCLRKKNYFESMPSQISSDKSSRKEIRSLDFWLSSYGRHISRARLCVYFLIQTKLWNRATWVCDHTQLCWYRMQLKIAASRITTQLKKIRVVKKVNFGASFGYRFKSFLCQTNTVRISCARGAAEGTSVVNFCSFVYTMSHFRRQIFCFGAKSFSGVAQLLI